MTPYTVQQIYFITRSSIRQMLDQKLRDLRRCSFLLRKTGICVAYQNIMASQIFESEPKWRTNRQTDTAM